MEASETELGKDPISTLRSPIPTTTAEQTTEPVASSIPDGEVERTQVDGDLAEGNQTNHDENGKI